MLWDVYGAVRKGVDVVFSELWWKESETIEGACKESEKCREVRNGGLQTSYDFSHLNQGRVDKFCGHRGCSKTVERHKED